MENPKKFFITPSKIWNVVNCNEYCVLGVMMTFQVEANKLNEPFTVSQVSISRVTGYDRKTVRKIIKSLEEKNLIKVLKNGNNLRKKASEYKLNLEWLYNEEKTVFDLVKEDASKVAEAEAWLKEIKGSEEHYDVIEKAKGYSEGNERNKYLISRYEKSKKEEKNIVKVPTEEEYNEMLEELSRPEFSEYRKEYIEFRTKWREMTNDEVKLKLKEIYQRATSPKPYSNEEETPITTASENFPIIHSAYYN